ncbi:MAG: hypothetical protein CL607_21060 [Anaerolineaceae bacterium]|nr:hypothetical protein [Anaerolineaceae bacterium]
MSNIDPGCHQIHPLLIVLVGLVVVAIMTMAPLFNLSHPQTPRQISYWNCSLELLNNDEI